MGHGERRRELERRFPGWEIWYVPRQPDGATWRARPRMLINADDPEDLAAAIRAVDNPVIPDSALLASPRGYAVRGRRPGQRHSCQAMPVTPAMPGAARQIPGSFVTEGTGRRTGPHG